MEFDNGEMIVIRHDYDEVYKKNDGTVSVERQSDAYWAIREPKSYDLSGEEPQAWAHNESYKIPGDIYLSDVDDIAAYRKLLDAVEARILERKAEKDA